MTDQELMEKAHVMDLARVARFRWITAVLELAEKYPNEAKDEVRFLLLGLLEADIPDELDSVVFRAMEAFSENV